MTDKEWFSRWIPNGTDEEKLARLRTEYYPKHPIVMPEWFRFERMLFFFILQILVSK